MAVRGFLVVLVLLLCMSAAYAGYPMQVTDSRGKRITIPARPVRIVSLAPSITEILFALGTGDRVVGVNSRSDYPIAATKKPKVGDVTISSEAVLALKPDLVLAHGYLNKDAITRLEKLKLRVFAVDPKTIPGVISDIRTLGKLTARPRTAESIAVGMERAVASARATRAKSPSIDVLVVIQSNPLWVAGPKTFVHEILGIVNARNVARDARPGFVPFSKELSISRSPDVIIVGLKSDAEYFLKSPEWRQTKAVKNKRIHMIKSDLLVRPGPRLADGLRELSAVLGR